MKAKTLKMPAAKLESPTYYRDIVRCIDQVAGLFRFIGHSNKNEWRGHEAEKWIVSGFDVGCFFGPDGKQIVGYYVTVRVGRTGDHGSFPPTDFSGLDQALPALAQIPEDVA